MLADTNAFAKSATYYTLLLQKYYLKSQSAYFLIELEIWFCFLSARGTKPLRNKGFFVCLSQDCKSCGEGMTLSYMANP